MQEAAFGLDGDKGRLGDLLLGIVGSGQSLGRDLRVQPAPIGEIAVAFLGGILLLMRRIGVRVDDRLLVERADADFFGHLGLLGAR